MSSITSYRDLLVWQRSMDLAQAIYATTSRFPPAERFGLTAQMRRAAVSIPSNIAEGQSRNSTGEFLNFLGIARGSLAELETQLLLAGRLSLLPEPEQADRLQETAQVGRLLNGLMRSLRSNS